MEYHFDLRYFPTFIVAPWPFYAFDKFEFEKETDLGLAIKKTGAYNMKALHLASGCLLC